MDSVLYDILDKIRDNRVLLPIYRKNIMQLKRYLYDPDKKALLIGISFLLIVVLIELICILLFNSGHVVYTLDDAYIHLALAENIQNGHYGINADEFSAPSSSILWPLILASLSFTAYVEYFPLFINIISAVGSLFFFWKILNKSIQIDNIDTKTKVISFLLILLIVGTNMIGLIFTGMEHSLQLLFVVIIAWGMISEIETKKVEPWLVLSILIAPLIRYENLAISIAAIFYLFFRRYFKLSVLLATLLILFIGSFSIFLTQSGLDPFSTSVLAKSSVISSGGNVESILGNVILNIRNPRGVFLSCALLGLMSFVLFSKKRDGKRLLASTISFAIILHLLVGRYGWYNRYEIYIWSITILVLLYIRSKTLVGLLTSNPEKINLVKMTILAGGVFVICTPYVRGLITLPVASNNIYEQQYQMHRFAIDYYAKPIAVNDIGYVSYRNDNYVLDLAGLASPSALTHRNDMNPKWMNDLAETNNVKFAMIYDTWFNNIPANWIKVGELHLGKERITPAKSIVAFYALNDDTYKETSEIIQNFRKTLPIGVTFIYEK